jgi:enoyl-CoA hydratase
VHYNTITCGTDSGVATITFNRPNQLNALSIDAILETASALKACENSNDISVVVLRGSGGRAFSAGADIGLFQNFKNAEDARNFWRRTGPQVHVYIEQMTKPVISVISGYCLGGGLEIALASDLVIATDDSKFGFPEVNLGLLPGWGGTQRVARIVGRHKAKQLVMLGETFDANEALRIGIINWVVEKANLDKFLDDLLTKLKQKSPLVLGRAKDAVNKAYEISLSEGLAYETELDTTLIATEDAKEGIRAFLDKRKPIFQGK